jgi:circadian clock protein KaiC
MPTSRRRTPRTRRSATAPALAKVPTGIAGFDEITGGGLPRGRPTLVCGGPGCGKTLFGLEFLIKGAEHGEPGVFVTFEETEQDLIENVASLGHDLAELVAHQRLAIEYVRVERSDQCMSSRISTTGSFSLNRSSSSSSASNSLSCAAGSSRSGAGAWSSSPGTSAAS